MDGQTVGARSSPFGHGALEVRDTAGNVVSRAKTKDANQVWLEGLAPDTAYTYRVSIEGDHGPTGTAWFGGLVPTGPEGGSSGEAGGTASGSAPRRQLTIRYRSPSPSSATSAEDDDWFFTFYQPYRYLLDHIPFYPSVGNHDSSHEERSDDRAQVSDNFSLEERFRKGVGTERSSLDPGLFSQPATARALPRWAGEAHFLLVDVVGDEARLTPVAGGEEGGGMRPIDIRTPKGERLPVPILVHNRRDE